MSWDGQEAFESLYKAKVPRFAAMTSYGMSWLVWRNLCAEFFQAGQEYEANRAKEQQEGDQ